MRLIAAFLVIVMSASLAAGEAPPQLDYGLDNLPIPKLPVTNQTNARTVKLLGEALGRSTGLDRVRYAREIGEAERAEGLALLQPLLTNTDPLLRQQAIESIGMLRPLQNPGVIKGLLKDPEASVRRQAVLTGAALGDASFVAEGLNDKDPEVVSAAIRVASAEHAPAIAGKLASLPATSQVQAMAALGRLKHTAAADEVAKFLDQPIPLKVAALQSLGKMEAKAKSDTVLAVLKDAHPTARREALWALVGVATVPVQQERAIAMLKDPDNTVRQAAAEILKLHPTPTGIDPLTEQLSTEYKPLHLESRNALLAVGAETIPTAVKLMDHAVPERRIDGSWLLGKLKSDAGFARHLELLKDKDWRVVAQAADSLGPIGNPGAKDPLIELVKNALVLVKKPTPDLAGIAHAGEMAIVSAARLKHEPILPVVNPILFDKGWPADMRGAGAFALGMLAGEDRAKDFRQYIDLQTDDMEASNVKGEGMKAIGNARITSVLSHLVNARGPAVDYDWLTHWTKDRLEGRTTPFNPLVPKWPDLSVVDRP